jgi:hypothetical protein
MKVPSKSKGQDTLLMNLAIFIAVLASWLPKTDSVEIKMDSNSKIQIEIIVSKFIKIY